jgi:predicted PurR-regulated permease PerM
MRRRVPGPVAYGLALVIVYAALLGFVALISLSIQDFVASIPAYEQEFERMLLGAGGILTDYGVDVDSLIASDRIIAPDQALALAATFTEELVAGLSNWGLVLVTSAFFLFEATSMPDKLRNVVEVSGPRVQRIIRFFTDVRYFVALSAGLGLAAAVLDAALLLALGVEFALLWGAFAFLMGFIPNIGMYLAIIPPAIMAYIQFGLPRTVAVVVGLLIIGQLLNGTVKNRFLRSRLDLSALAIYLSLMLWGWVLGPIGVLVAVPLALLVKAILASRPETRWVAYLMGNGQETFRPQAEHDESQLAQVAG